MLVSFPDLRNCTDRNIADALTTRSLDRDLWHAVRKGDARNDTSQGRSTCRNVDRLAEQRRCLRGHLRCDELLKLIIRRLPELDLRELRELRNELEIVHRLQWILICELRQDDL